MTAAMAPLRLGDGLSKPPPGAPAGKHTTRRGEAWYQIDNYDAMPPFFISKVSPSNLWCYLSTRGGLTCGRVSSEQSLFPYCTADKIEQNSDHTGPCTMVQVTRDGARWLWQPFAPHPRLYSTTRRLYKALSGEKVEFEEENHDLRLRFSYTWSSTEEFGFVRRCCLANTGTDPVEIRVLDGLLHVLAAGVNPAMQDSLSLLVDAYNYVQLEPDSKAGLFCLYALPWDRAEPKESLKANVVYQRGLPSPVVVLSARQLPTFREGGAVAPEALVRGQQGAYLVQAEFPLQGAAERMWVMVADVNQNHGAIAALRKRLMASSDEDIFSAIAEAERAASTALRNYIAAADGLQLTQDTNTTAHHQANVVFNIMRGGLFDANYTVRRPHFIAFVRSWDAPVADAHQAWLAALPEALPMADLVAQARATGDKDLVRLALEYLPLFFSRRHGDPSRPWNKFSIHLKDAGGNKLLTYQGNWRDIFQNWEALSLSYPLFLPGMIAKFVNASTADGYNPYRVSSEGIDWEVTDPHDPWSFIGYWGDHQIVYLLRLLEWMRRFDPAVLLQLLQEDIFAYANVPYFIRPYPEIVANPKDTIVFNHARHAEIQTRVKAMGSDGKLVLGADGKVLTVNLLEKLLVSVLAKLGNFVVEGGIWLNTQRPEWNDANNALVGIGLSMVTTFQLRRWLEFVADEVKHLPTDTMISAEVLTWFEATKQAFVDAAPLLHSAISPTQRRALVDVLGGAAAAYRGALYEKGLSGTRAPLAPPALAAFFQAVLPFVDHTIRVNRTDTGLYHSYNLLRLGPNTADVAPLYLMLEGQVCALSSGLLQGAEATAVVTGLRQSALYRAKDDSYLLYPDRQLPHFMARNVIPADRLALPGLQYILAQKLTTLAYLDCEGQGHFGDQLSNAADLSAAVQLLLPAHPPLGDHTAELLATFEAVFHHSEFTGRSGTFFAFEGLGCIYWHLVAKLLVALQELCRGAEGTTAHAALQRQYYEVRAGMGGFNKTPLEYGAFPMDPYSHTPAHAGAQQPGMTGQVKDEILCRFAELGVVVSGGTVAFAPKLLRRAEFLAAPQEFHCVDVSAQPQCIPLAKDELAFTYCQVPVVYRLGEAAGLKVTTQTRGAVELPGPSLTKELTAALVGRTGEITAIVATIPEADLV